MRKRCVSCGFIGLKTDDYCKKCGSDDLQLIPAQSETLIEDSILSRNPLSFWNYLFNFGFAIFLEFLALLPILLFIGSHGKGTSEFEIKMKRILFAVHLPTVLPFWLLSKYVDKDFILLAPLTQVIFWMWFLNFVTRKLKGKLK